ncbi:MAG TPA: cation:proton antiporter [Rhodanobacteraceae bacterium]|jgi:Kef-type K+ transport system membrane component KefB|nr:cation:proton antiporter [Rhodanobacteraceae bacterium]
MDHTTAILLDVFVIFAAAQVGGWLARAVRLPDVVGQIVAGCLIGPSVLGWIAPNEPLEVLSEIGVVLLLFAVGLETRLEDVKRVGGSAFAVGVIGVIVPFAAGAVWAHSLSPDWPRSLFVAAAFVATSAGITASVLKEMGVLRRIESRVILGAAVIDDILAMLLLGIVVAIQAGGSLRVGTLAVVAAEAVGFVLVVGWLGTLMMRRGSKWLDRARNPMSPLLVVLALCLGLAWLSTRFGLAAIIGAFLAGMIASETHQRAQLEEQMQPLLALLTPFFFVLTGAKVELAKLASGEALWLLLIATLLAIATKLVGGWLGAIRLGPRSALIVGVGMIPRGEVGIVVAALGLSAGVFGDLLYAVIIAMSLLTSIIAPPFLALLLKGGERGAGNGEEKPVAES